MVKNFIQIVQILCKIPFKSLRKSYAKFCVKFLINTNCVEIQTFPPTFPHFFTAFPTTNHSLSPPSLFHFFTSPTITIINKLEERN